MFVLALYHTMEAYQHIFYKWRCIKICCIYKLEGAKTTWYCLACPRQARGLFSGFPHKLLPILNNSA